LVALQLHQLVVLQLAQRLSLSQVLVSQAGRKLLQERIRSGLSLVPEDPERWALDLWRFLAGAYRATPPDWTNLARELWEAQLQRYPCPRCQYFWGKGGLVCAIHPSGPSPTGCRDVVFIQR
jgi:hypothetical protein